MVKRDLFGSHRFWIEINSIDEGYFSECSGLQVETEMLSWEEGGVNDYVYQLPVRAKFSNIILKRGMATTTLWDWYRQSHKGQVERKNISIKLQAYTPTSGSPKAFCWSVTGCLPVKWQGPTLNTNANDIAVESIEFVHEGFEMYIIPGAPPLPPTRPSSGTSRPK